MGMIRRRRNFNATTSTPGTVFGCFRISLAKQLSNWDVSGVEWRHPSVWCTLQGFFVLHMSSDTSPSPPLRHLN